MYHIEAPKYLERNIITFPVKDKFPAIETNWRELSESDVSGYVETRIGFGIAMACGEESGFVFIDIDTEDQELQRLIMNYIDKEMPSGILRYGNTKRLPSLVYKYEGQTARKIQIGKNAVIEILSNGRYCVLPPSEHPTQAEPYRWNVDIHEQLNGYEHWPSFTEENVDALQEIVSEYSSKLDLTEQSTMFTRDVQKNYEFQKRVGEPDACVHDSHNYLVDCVCYYLDLLEGKDLLKKILFLDSEINEDRGFTSYFDDRDRGGKNQRISKEERAQKMIDGLTETTNRDRKRRGLGPIEAFKPLPFVSENLIEVPKKTIVTKKEKSPKREIPKAPDGALNDMFHAIYDSSHIKRSRLSLCAALNIISIAIGTRATFYGTYANIYSIIVADSGAGKNHPLKSVHNVLSELGYDYLIGEQNLVSTKGAIAELSYFPERVDVVDEFGRLLKKANDKGSNVSDVFDVYNQLYTDVSGHYGGVKIDMNGRRVKYGECDNPFVSFIGATTPSAFSESFNEEMFLQGWGSRSLMFCEEKFKRSSFKSFRNKLSVPSSVSNVFSNIRVSSLVDRALTQPLLDKNSFPTKAKDERKTIELKADNNAIRMLEALHTTIETLRETAHYSNNTLAKVLLARRFNMIKKIAMISAVSSNCINGDLKETVIREHDVDYAQRIVNFLGLESQEFIRKNMFKSQHEKNIKRVVSIIENATDEGITEKKIISLMPEMQLSDMAKTLGWIKDYHKEIHVEDNHIFYSKKFINIIEGA